MKYVYLLFVWLNAFSVVINTFIVVGWALSLIPLSSTPFINMITIPLNIGCAIVMWQDYFDERGRGW